MRGVSRIFNCGGLGGGGGIRLAASEERQVGICGGHGERVFVRDR